MKITKIVAVEDERIVALHLKQQLSKLGYEVSAVAASGDKALQAILEFRPDIVLMDIHIEGAIDGIETAARIPADLGIPVIYLTAYSEEATLDRARATKPYGYLIKPYSERELHATIQMALERRDVESALRISEDRFRSIFSAISDGVFIVDGATGTFSEINEPGSLMFGYALGELIGQDMETLSSDEAPFRHGEATAWIQKAADTGEPQRFDWQCKTKDGQFFTAEISLRYAVIGGKMVVLAIARDLTERQAIEAQLRQAQKMEAVGQLTGGIAHDFNNLLGVVIGNLDLLRNARPDDPEVDELSGEALQAALGGADLTRRLLAFARRQPLQPQRIDLNALVRETVQLLRRVLGENIEISLRFADDICCVIADPSQLGASLTNLATNARDAMPGGGKLSLATRHVRLGLDDGESHPDLAPGEYAIIEVTDTGKGMAPEVAGHIFEPFYTTKGRDEGTGLGLSMVFGFLKQSGGHVSVYSEEGVGSTFRLYLPYVSEADAPPDASQAQILSAAGGETVLVVEDSAPLRRVAARQLKELGYRVLEARNGARAMLQLEANTVDVLFTDVVMPGDLDGFALAIEASRRWPDLKVLVTSGFPETGLAGDLAARRFRLLAKPYRKTDLALMLRELLGQSAAG